MYFTVGIDLGGTNIKVGVVDKEGKIIHKQSCPTGADRDYIEIVKDMTKLTTEVVEKSGVNMENVKSIGIGSPGSIDSDNGVILSASNLNFINVPFRFEFNKYIEKPVFVENDANCAALGEYKICRKDIKSLVFITLGTGIGGGIIINGQIYKGINGEAGEFGHTTFAYDGETCACGRRGCWERYASVSALVNMTKKSAIENPQGIIATVGNGNLDSIEGKTAFFAARKGDRQAIAIVNCWIEYVAHGVVNIINILQPEVVIIGGAVSNEGDKLINPVRQLAKKYCSKAQICKTQIIKAGLGNDAGIIGAAFLEN